MKNDKKSLAKIGLAFGIPSAIAFESIYSKSFAE